MIEACESEMKNEMNRRTFIASSVALGGVAFLGKLQMSNHTQIPMITNRTNNPALKTILPTWEGTPLDKNGCFMNHEFPNSNDFSKALKWMTQKNPQKELKKNDTWKMPVITDDGFLNSTEDMIVFLGHATFFIRLGGKQILIDPVFGTLPFQKRYTEFPISTDKLVNIDYVLVSHDHRDHCDEDSIKLLQKQNPKAIFLTGLKMKSVLGKWAKANEIQEAGWYQQYKLDDDLEINFLPSRHWSRRSLNDTNKHLWGAFVIKSNDKTIYFGGDSGYGSHFKEVGSLFPNIDVALIGAASIRPAGLWPITIKTLNTPFKHSKIQTPRC